MTKENYVIGNYSKIVEFCDGSEDMAQEAICQLFEKKTKTSFQYPGKVVREIITRLKNNTTDIECMPINSFKEVLIGHNKIEDLTSMMMIDFVINELRSLKSLSNLERDVFIEIAVNDFPVADVANIHQMDTKMVKEIMDEAIEKVRSYFSKKAKKELM